LDSGFHGLHSSFDLGSNSGWGGCVVPAVMKVPPQS
jgi:hypothetical protein